MKLLSPALKRAGAGAKASFPCGSDRRDLRAGSGNSCAILALSDAPSLVAVARRPFLARALRPIFCWRVGARPGPLVIGVKCPVRIAHTTDGDHCGPSQIPRNHVLGGLESEGSPLGTSLLRVRIPCQRGRTRGSCGDWTLPGVCGEVGNRCWRLARALWVMARRAWKAKQACGRVRRMTVRALPP